MYVRTKLEGNLEKLKMHFNRVNKLLKLFNILCNVFVIKILGELK